jgi:hypothetical protein
MEEQMAMKGVYASVGFAALNCAPKFFSYYTNKCTTSNTYK